eukprot:CAMPEP_0202890242 /NCGR_PEP_ID=MMETSP1392-20130828/727_1 /ASSEMBLY_ACC=CAM_ASM_000868 /TAXON_ID=225041 /ORGANISM="Chlamydomonas chlamydogama, Strain SAG 11-48b" /LENGTH=435 /DNA_ID=CAMNT_0049573779 /DNA_START=27 /DNA_END=1334 /DNA_ORIENTATION=+
METAARFVAAYCGVSGAEPTTSSSGVVQLQTKEGLITGLGTVAQYLAKQSSKAQQLLGASAEDQAQVAEWLLWAVTELTPLVDDKLFKVNDHLATRTFLVGSSLTLADLVVFGVVHPAVVAFPVAQTLHFANLLRWADHTQYLSGPAASVLPVPLVLKKSQFAPPPPPAPPAPKAAPSPAPAASGAAPAAPKAAPAAPAAEASKSKGDAKAKPAAAPTEAKAEAGKADGKAAAKGDAKAAKGEAKADGKAKGEGKGEGKKGGEGGGKKEEEEPHIGMLDIRVGTIVKVDKHPNADALYLEEIDVGEDKPRQVISGLVKFVPQDKMAGRRVLVVCNLKPAKMREVMSYGMVLCASNDAHDQVDPVNIPEGVPNGERITFEGYPGPPLEEVNPKKKILERLFPDMKTDDKCVPNYKGAVFMTSKGPITATIPNGSVA